MPRPFATGVAALVAVAALATACEGTTNAPERTAKIGAGVRLTSTELPTGVHARVARGITAPFPHTRRLAQVFRLTPGGSLPIEATLTLPLTKRVSKGVPVLVASAEKRGGRWVALPATLTPDRKHVRVTVTRFSWFTVFTTSVGDILAELKSGVLDGLSAGATANAGRPRCGGEDAARSEDYNVASDTGSTLYWCFGFEDGERVLRVVNNRRYPLALKHPGFAVEKQGGGGLAAERLSRIGSGEDAILSPRQEMVFSVTLGAGGIASVRSVFDGVGFSLYQLQFGVESAIAILSRFGLARGERAAEVAAKLLDSSKCASAVGGTGGDVIRSCFSVKTLFEALGAKAFLVAPIMITGPVWEFFRSSFNAIGDQLNGRDRYRVRVWRSGVAVTSPPPTPQPPPAAPAPQPQPTPTPPPAQTGFAIGDPFDLECQVAWPTAPSRTSTHIVMMMQCPGIPNDYLLVQVAYADPNLPIYPSTGPVRVRGQIVDVAQSELGFKILLVAATEIDL